jgi:ABC-type branched-subunit amino acid transport system ATPase component
MFEVKNLTKQFGNLVALDNLNFTVDKRKNFWNNR